MEGPRLDKPTIPMLNEKFSAVLDELKANASMNNEREPFYLIGTLLQGFSKEEQERIVPQIAALNIPKVSGHLLRYGSILTPATRDACVATVVASGDPFEALEARKTQGLSEENIKALDMVIESSDETWPKGALSLIRQGRMPAYEIAQIE
jgi:hypothetical protein